MIVRYGVCYTLEQNGLTGLRLGHDKSPLPLSYRCEEVYYTA